MKMRSTPVTRSSPLRTGELRPAGGGNFSKTSEEYTPTRKYVGNGTWGGKTYRAILGGGEGTYYRVRPPNPVLEASESGIGLAGGGERIIGAGVQNRFWGGVLWYASPLA